MIYERVDNEKPFVGMTNFKGDYVTVDDVKIAKNYLSEIYRDREMRQLESDFDKMVKMLNMNNQK